MLFQVFVVVVCHFKLWWAFCSVERNRLCNGISWLSKKHMCESILNSGQYFKGSCPLKIVFLLLV